MAKKRPDLKEFPETFSRFWASADQTSSGWSFRMIHVEHTDSQAYQRTPWSFWMSGLRSKFRLPSSWWCLQWLALVDTCTWETRWGVPKLGNWNLLGVSDFFLRAKFHRFFFFWSSDHLSLDIPCFWELRVGGVKIVCVFFFKGRNRCKKRPEVDGMMKLGKGIHFGNISFVKRQCCCLTSLWPQEWEHSFGTAFQVAAGSLDKLDWLVGFCQPTGVERCDG